MAIVSFKGNFLYLCLDEDLSMLILFDVVFLEEAYDFLKNINPKHREKILYNIRKSQIEPDVALFKKLHEEIWEFRTRYQRTQYRMLAFWDKSESASTLVITTHGFIKKQSKVPSREILRALKTKEQYFKEKKK